MVPPLLSPLLLVVLFDPVSSPAVDDADADEELAEVALDA